MTTSATGTQPASFTNKNRVTGIASTAAGFDTNGIVNSLMAIERRPYDDLDYKRQSEQLRLQAYQAVNTALLAFRSSVSGLSSRSLWNAKMTSSTNEKSIVATANEYAVKGAYSFKVAQVAAATEYASRAVLDSKAPLAPPKKVPDPENEGEMMDGPPEKIGEIHLASAKTRVDNSAKLEQLNGGEGVFRGSIRITDSNNGAANIDLSSAITLDDVVRTINSASGVRISASMRDGKLYIEDEAGGNSTMKIQNVGAGTTATDLGIAGTSKKLYEDDGVTPLLDDSGRERQALHGRNVYTLGRNMSLSMLNDGLGVEEGDMGLRVYGKNKDGDDSFFRIAVNLDGTKTVGDVIDRVNKEIEAAIAKGTFDAEGGGDPAQLLKNLHFGISSDGTSFGFTGVAEGNAYSFENFDTSQVVGQSTPADQLGLTNGVQSVGAGEREVSFGRVLGDANSPMLKNLGGVAGQGVGEYGSGTRVPVPFNGNTLISDLNNGEGLNTSTGINFILREGGQDSNGVDISAENNIISNAVNIVEFRQWLEDNPDATVDDLLQKLNEDINAYASDPANNAAGLNGFNLSLDPYSAGIVVDGIQPGYSLQIGGALAASLGITHVRGSGTIGTALELNPVLYDHDAQLRNATDEFYGMGEYSVDLRGGGNDDITFGDPEADPPVAGTALGDLEALFADGKTIADLFGAGEGITIRMGNEKDASGTIGYTPDGGTTHESALSVTVNWDELTVKDADGNDVPLVIDEDTDLGVLMGAMNKALADKFAAAGYEGSVPQLRVNSLASGLQWSNMDFSNYWEMDDAGSGGAAEAMNLDRAWTEDLTEKRQRPASPTRNLSPARTGYLEERQLTADNADEVTLGELNYGIGVTLEGEEDETVTIEFKPGTNGEDEPYNGKMVSFTMKELRDAVTAKLTATGKTDRSQLTVQEYLDTLNALVDEKIDDYYDANEPDVDADDRFGMEFKASDNKFIVGDIENAEGLKIAGTALTDIYGTKTGLAPTASYTKEQLDSFAENGTEIPVNILVGVGTFHGQTIDGLGEIFFTLDGKDGVNEIFKLNTTGLTQESTLNDLVNHLNDQLAELARNAAPGSDDALLADIRFTINDAGTGIAVDNGSNARLAFIDSFQLKQGELDENGDPITDDDKKTRLPDAQRLAQDLGLVGADGESKTVEAYSYYNAKSLGKNYISRATSLEEFAGKNALDLGRITLTNAGGASREIALNGMKTLGDLMDYVNSLKFGVRMEINPAGDGLTVFEDYEGMPLPAAEDRQGQISILDVDGGISMAKKLGIAGRGVRSEDTNGVSVFRGSLSTTIEVMSTDSLEDIMYRISEAGYKTSISTDENGSTLSVSATNTGEKNDFVLESDIPQLSFGMVKRGKDAKVLYGDPDSSGSPRMFSSSTNSNSNAIMGVTLDIKAASAEWTTITIEDDKEKVTEAVKTMVGAYNDLSNIIKMLDAYDQETGEEGILFGDSNVRTLMDDINEFFYDVYNPNNVRIGTLDDDGKQQTWTWMDLGITLNAQPSNADGTGGWYNVIELDEEALSNMVATNWEVMSKMLSNEQNISNINSGNNTKPTATFNGDMAEGFSVDGAVNGNTGKSAFGSTNGVKAADTIEKGSNAYTIWFQKATTMNRMSLYFPSSDDSLKDFTVEFLNSETGQWEELRNTEGNHSDMVSYGFMSDPKTADAIRITAKATNAKDGKFALLDVQVFEETGLAGRLNQHTTELGDTQFGFLKTMNDEIQESLRDIEEQMTNLEEKLTAKEEALWRRFTAMETAMSKLQGQGDYFKNMMKSLNGGSE